MPEPGVFVHFILYFALGALARNDFRAEPAGWLSSRASAWAVVFSILYGLSDEVHQLYVPGRTFQLTDLAIDFTGALCGVVVFGFISRKLSGKAGTE